MSNLSGYLLIANNSELFNKLVSDRVPHCYMWKKKRKKEEDYTNQNQNFRNKSYTLFDQGSFPIYNLHT